MSDEYYREIEENGKKAGGIMPAADVTASRGLVPKEGVASAANTVQTQESTTSAGGSTALAEESTAPAEETSAPGEEITPTAEEERALARTHRRRRRRKREKRSRERRIRIQFLFIAAAVMILIALFVSASAKRQKQQEEEKKKAAKEKMRQEEQKILEKEEELLSDSVLQYKDLMEYYAEEEGIYEYVPVLLAIMETETKGERDDVMQSSESAGLEPDSLGPEDSIAQACDYFRGLVDRADDLGCDTRAIIQAYNYGPGYLYYVADRGGKHSFDLAVDYAEEMSDGRTAAYTHYIADDNDNWIYLYGNMYYVKLVEQYLPQ